MKRAEKKEVVEDLHERFSKAKALVLTDYRGLDTSAMHALRSQLRGASVEYRVVKNTLMLRASDGTDKLEENLATFLDTIVRLKPASSKGTYLKSISISTTMGPGIKIDPAYVKPIAK